MLFRSAVLTSLSLRKPLTIWIDPVSVTHYNGNRWAVVGDTIRKFKGPKPLRNSIKGPIKLFEPFLLDDSSFPPSAPIEEDPRYVLVTDFMAHRDTPRESHWYRMLLSELEENGVARHKAIRLRSTEDIDNFLNGYATRLIDSMEATGYQVMRGVETGYARIDAQGQLVKSASACHRFFTARNLGVGPVPLQVWSVHRDWLNREKQARGLSTEKALLAAVAERDVRDG